MQVFYWIVLLIVIGIAVFAIQNSNAPLVTIKLLLWKFETSLVYTILGSIGLGIFITLLFWIPRAIRASIRRKKVPQDISST
ncbi:MAG: LapA family protein [Desulfobacterales bacterium]|jgi:uncharacterized integral membrane protein|nr:LapA family protein [Desulfobacterales bacterium]